MTLASHNRPLTRALLGAGFAWAAAMPMAALELGLPVDCTLGETCYIQQYFDHDAGPGWADFTCGTLAYDGHDGTDFAVPTRADMAAGVAVIASAAGTVKGVRDGVADFAPKVEGRECGNGVVIDHGAGWETQYCHLAQGSVSVAVGQRVDQGTPLGLVGQSGMADFPHVHVSVRKNGVKLDPFFPNRAPSANSCALDTTPVGRDDLWQPDIAYQAGGILDAGFATAVPEYDAIKAGLDSPSALPAQSPALVIWAFMFGTRQGDTVILDLTGPEGRIAAQRIVMEKNQAQMFRATGRKMRGDGWPAGDYTGTATLTRDGAVIDEVAVSVTITP